MTGTFDLSALSSLFAGSGGTEGGSVPASAVGGMAAATPYGAAANAAASVANKALEPEKGNSATGGLMQNVFNQGINIGSAGASGGSASQSATQTQPGVPGVRQDVPGALSNNLPLIVGVGFGVLIVGILVYVAVKK
jgi:hypothetical protein